MEGGPSTLQFSDGGAGSSAAHRRGAAYVVLSADSAQPLASPQFVSLAALDELTVGRGAELRFESQGARSMTLRVPDGWASTQHARFHRRGAMWSLEDCGSSNGTWLDGKPLEGDGFLQDGSCVEIGKSFLVFRAGVGSQLGDSAMGAPFERSGGDLCTLSVALHDTYAALLRLAASPVSVLLLGESGIGKEVAARAVHRASGRVGPFVAINCGALSPTLIDAELFGHKKGAFTGASEASPGLIAWADGGTLFLDEIAELPPAAQVKLLRVLQEREVLPVGGVRPVPVDLRVVAATCEPLPGLVEAGDFRTDLYARVAAYTCSLPPLRERREDLGLLIGTLLRRLAPERAPTLSFHRSAMRSFFQYPWPLNIRELEQTLSVMLALDAGPELRPQSVPDRVRSVRPSGVPPSSISSAPDEPLQRQLRDQLERHRGNVSAVARDMNKARVQIRRWCKRFELDPESFR